MTITVDNINFLRPSDFILRIDSAEFAKMTYNCQAVSLPGLTVGPVSNIRHPKAKVAIAGDSAEFDQLSVTFKIDEEMLNYQALLKWLLDQVNTDDMLNKDLTLFIYNSNNQTNRQIKFFNVIPTNLTPLEFDLKMNATDYLSATVSFAIDYFEIS